MPITFFSQQASSSRSHHVLLTSFTTPFGAEVFIFLLSREGILWIEIARCRHVFLGRRRPATWKMSAALNVFLFQVLIAAQNAWSASWHCGIDESFFKSPRYRCARVNHVVKFTSWAFLTFLAYFLCILPGISSLFICPNINTM